VALVVGVDMATAEVRAVAADGGGAVRAEASAPLPPPVSPAPGHVEQDASAWWPAVAVALSSLTARLGDEAGTIAAVTVASTSGTVVALDAAGEPIGPALLYSDQRAVAQAEAAQAAAGPRWAALGLRVQPSFGLPKWAWLLASTTATATATAPAALAHQCDVVVARLTGAARPPTDWSHALKSGYDPERGEWVAEALAALDIPTHLLPEVRRPTEVLGAVTPGAAGATGVPAGCPVRAGMTDACAAQLAAGAGEPGAYVSVLGSTLVLKGAADRPVADPTGAVYSHRHPDGWWLPGGASNTGGGALRAAFPGADLAALDREAADHGPARAVAYPLAGRGERFPFVAPEAEGFVEAGDTGGGEGGVDRYRAMLEGVAFVERLGYERLAALGAPARPPVAACGGGSGSRVWTRIRATVLGHPLVEKPAATTALGAAILAAAGSLHPDLAAATVAMSAAGQAVDPDEREQAALDAGYHRFLDAVGARGWLG
jgi:sugar (pentulose or hexulose) kinase